MFRHQLCPHHTRFYAEAMRPQPAAHPTLPAISIHGTRFPLKVGKILQQHAMHKDVATTDLAQQNALGGIVEEAGVVARRVVVPGRQQPQDGVLEDGT